MGNPRGNPGVGNSIITPVLHMRKGTQRWSDLFMAIQPVREGAGIQTQVYPTLKVSCFFSHKTWFHLDMLSLKVGRGLSPC